MQEVALGLRERKKAYTREIITIAAWTLFQQRGVAETSIREIAELAEVAEKTVWNYFSSKEELVTAALDAILQVNPLLEFVAARPEDEHPATVLRRALSEASEGMTNADARALQKMMESIQQDLALSTANLRYLQSLADSLADVMRDRAPHFSMTQAQLRTLTACYAAIVDSVAIAQPARVTAKAWGDHLDRELARLERAWTTEGTHL